MSDNSREHLAYAKDEYKQAVAYVAPAKEQVPYMMRSIAESLMCIATIMEERWGAEETEPVLEPPKEET